VKKRGEETADGVISGVRDGGGGKGERREEGEREASLAERGTTDREEEGAGVIEGVVREGEGEGEGAGAGAGAWES
jgi:hypothetical protein